MTAAGVSSVMPSGISSKIGTGRDSRYFLGIKGKFQLLCSRQSCKNLSTNDKVSFPKRISGLRMYPVLFCSWVCPIWLSVFTPICFGTKKNFSLRIFSNCITTVSSTTDWTMAALVLFGWIYARGESKCSQWIFEPTRLIVIGKVTPVTNKKFANNSK